MNALRTWRKANNLRLETLASRLRISDASLSRIERGEQWPSRETLARISEETGGEVTPNDFMAPADAPSLSESEAAE